MIEDRKLISDKFNNFFVNVGPTLAKKIDHSSKCPTHFISYDAVHRFYLEPVTENELLKIISNFSDSSMLYQYLNLEMKCYFQIIVRYLCCLFFQRYMKDWRTTVSSSSSMTTTCCTIFNSGSKNENQPIWHLLYYWIRSLTLWIKVNM